MEKKSLFHDVTYAIIGNYCHEVHTALHIVVNYINKKTVEQISMYYYGEGVNIMIYCYICKKNINVVTCDYNDF